MQPALAGYGSPQAPAIWLWLAALALNLAATPLSGIAQSQATTGVIRGMVFDAAGSPIAGATIEFLHYQTSLVTTVHTTPSGTFARPLLPVGTYDIIASADDHFSTAIATGLSLHVGEVLTVTLRFETIELAEITVVAEPEHLIHAEDITSSTRLSAEAIAAIPNNGRNFLDLALLTPGVAISQGPDGDELNISGQRGIFNNFIVDGADFNNPFFGEQRGGQRPAFTFSQDAIEEVVVVNQGAPAEFGRSAGGFVNVITKSGTNNFAGSAHYFGQWDGLSASYPVAVQASKPDFIRNQFGFTLGGPIVRDRAFFFVAYDQQVASETKQTSRQVKNPADLVKLQDFLSTQWPGLFPNEFGPITRTDDARALVAKADWHLGSRHQISFKYNYNWSRQLNGTFDVDSWGLSANGVEYDDSHAFNVSARTLWGSTLFNELRIQWAREDRIRWYDGPLLPGATPPATPQFIALGGRPFPDIGMDYADGFRIGLPYFLPIDPSYDTRVQIVQNWSWLVDSHFLKFGAEYNRTSAKQQFIGFANGRYIFDSVDGFINFVRQGSRFVTCSDGSQNDTGVCPEGANITGPVQLYLQSGTVPGIAPEQLGIGNFDVTELAIFLQDEWKPSEHLTVNVGLRWEGTWHPAVAIEPEDTFYAPYLSDPNFPSDGTIPDDLDNIQPRIGITWDVAGDARTIVRLNVGAYNARIPTLVFAQSVTTNGAFQQQFIRSSHGLPEHGPPQIGELIDGSAMEPFLPNIHVTSRDLELPRTWSFALGIDREVIPDVAAGVSYQHAHADKLFRFINRNDAAFGSPFGLGTHPGGGGIGTLTSAESTARSRYHAVTVSVRGNNAFNDFLTFDLSYTLSYDRSDDDNERDPFSAQYANATRLEREYNWSDRDRRHKVTGYLAFSFPGGVTLANVVRYLSASPVSASCLGGRARAEQPTDRICSDGSILRRNTLRRGNEFFTWDVKLTRPIKFRGGNHLEPVLEVFNLTNANNSLDTFVGSLLFNFDGALRSGLGDTRRAQLGLRMRF